MLFLMSTEGLSEKHRFAGERKEEYEKNKIEKCRNPFFFYHKEKYKNGHEEHIYFWWVLYLFILMLTKIQFLLIRDY